MFKFFKSDPLAQLKKQYEKKLREARDAQRHGQMPLYARLTAESHSIAREMERLEQKR